MKINLLLCTADGSMQPVVIIFFAVCGKKMNYGPPIDTEYWSNVSENDLKRHIKYSMQHRKRTASPSGINFGK